MPEKQSRSQAKIPVHELQKDDLDTTKLPIVGNPVLGGVRMKKYFVTAVVLAVLLLVALTGDPAVAAEVVVDAATQLRGHFLDAAFRQVGNGCALLSSACFSSFGSISVRRPETASRWLNTTRQRKPALSRRLVQSKYGASLSLAVL